MNALRVNYQLEILDWDCQKDAQSSKVYFEAQCLLHNMGVNLNLAWEKLKDLDKILEGFLKKCSNKKVRVIGDESRANIK